MKSLITHKVAMLLDNYRRKKGSIENDPESWCRGVRFETFRNLSPCLVRNGHQTRISRSDSISKYNSSFQITNWNRE